MSALESSMSALEYLEINMLLVWLADHDERGFIQLLARLGFWLQLWEDSWTNQ